MKNKRAIHCILFLFATILIFINLLGTGFGVPNSGMEANITFNQTPLINQNTDLTVSFLSQINATNTTANISLPNGIELISGSIYWNVDLIEDIASNHTVIIKINSTGNFTIETFARYPISGESYIGAKEIIYLEVIDNSTIVSYTKPLPPLWNYTKLGINTLEDPTNSTINYTLNITYISPNSTHLREKVYSPFNETQSGNGTDGTVTVKGRALFERRTGGNIGVKFATVWVWDDDGLIGDDLLWSGLTDENGRFTSDPINNIDSGGFGTQDIYVQFVAGSSVGVIQNFFELWYDFFTEIYPNVPDGVLDIGNWEQPDDEPEPWWLYDDILSGYLYMEDEADPYVIIDDVQVEWPAYDPYGTSYHHDLNPPEIHINDGHENDRDVVLHEYGHHIMYSTYGEFPDSDCPSSHSIQRRSGPVCAWTEGWANYAPLFIDNDPFYRDTTQVIFVDFEDGDFFWWDEGDEVEGRVTASLWDFADTGNEDYYDGNFNDDIWNTFERQNDDRLSQYWSAWKTDHSSSEEDDALITLAQNTIYYASSEFDCTNGIDEDGDNFIDCADADCTQGEASANGFCCGSGCSTNGGTCQDASVAGFTCTDGNCNTYSESCRNGELETNLVCSGTSLSCSGGNCEENFGAPDSCDELFPGNSVCEQSPGPNDERACELTGTNCYLEAEFQCNAPTSCDELDENVCSVSSGFQCEWQGTYGDNVAEECESSCGAISQCDERDPGFDYAKCDTAGQTYFADECSGSCGGTDRDNICRSANSLGSGDGCTANVNCNGQTAGTGNCDLSCNYVPPNNPPIVNLVSPANNSVDLDGNIAFNCSVTDDNSLSNITLYGSWGSGWHANETKTLSGTSGSAEFNKTINDGIYIWNCLAYDTGSLSDWADANRTFNVTLAPIIPQIIFTSPTPSNATQQTNADIYLNVSVSDTDDYYVLTDIDRDLRLWIRFDDVNSSGSPVDLSSYSNNGTLNGGAFIDENGYWSNALQLDGIDDYVNLSKPSSLQFNNEPFTIAAWAKRGANSTDIGRIIGADSGGSASHGFLLGYEAPVNKWFFKFANGTANLGLYSTSNLSSEWTFVTGQYNGTDNIIYINGVLENTKYVGEIRPDWSQVPEIDIGSRSGTANFFNGTIDETFIFKRALSDNEIKALYNATANKYSNNFTKMTDGTHSFIAHAVDKSANKNQTELRTIFIDNLDLTELSVIYQNNTERAFRFVINNTLASQISDISWKIDTGKSTISSLNSTLLQSNEDLFVFIYYNYTSSGSYRVRATAESQNYIDIQEIMITV